MEAAAQLAGFFAAHAVWCVSEGETLIPLLALEREDGTRELQRLVGKELHNVVERGKGLLDRSPEAAACAVLIYGRRSARLPRSQAQSLRASRAPDLRRHP